MKRNQFLLALVGSLLMVGSMGRAKAAENLNGAGASFPYPIYSKWFDLYARETGVQINYQSIGSGGGIQQLKAKTVDFGASDAPLSDAEAKAMPSPVVHIPTVAGAVVISYNIPGVGAGLRLDGPTLAGIFLGEIRTWNDPRLVALNRGLRLPNRPIAVAHRSDASGTSYIFTHYLAAVSPEWADKVGSGKAVNWPTGVGGKGNEGVAGVIRQIPGGIGYIELAYAIVNRLPYAEMKNASGRFVKPTIATTAAAAAGGVSRMKRDVRVSVVNSRGADAYPIVGFTYLLIYRNMPASAKERELVGFLNWAMREGQKYPASLYYAPLPPSVVALNEQTIRSIR